MFATVISFAQESTLFSVNYSVKDFLPSNECYEIIQSKTGYYWIATDNGVVRFDGKGYRVFTTEDGLSDNVVLNLFEDEKGRLWCAGLNNELSFITAEDSVVTYPYNTEIAKACVLHERSDFGKQIIYALVIKEDEVWLGYRGVGIVHVGSDGSFEVVGSGSVNSDYVVRNVGEDVVFGTLYSDRTSSSFSLDIDAQAHQLQRSDVRSEYVFRAAKFEEHLFFTASNQCLYSVKGNQSCNLDLPSGGISLNVFEGEIWVGTLNNGAYLCEMANDEIKIVQHYFENLSITSVLKSTDGSYWFTSREKGLFYVPNLSTFRYSFKTENSNFSDFRLTSSNLFLTDSKGKIQRLTEQLTLQKEWVTHETEALLINENLDHFSVSTKYKQFEVGKRDELAVSKRQLAFETTGWLNKEYVLTPQAMLKADSSLVKDFSKNRLKSVYQANDIAFFRFIKGFSVFKSDGTYSSTFLKGENIIDITSKPDSDVFYLCTSNNTIYSFHTQSYTLKKIFQDAQGARVNSIAAFKGDLFISRKNGLWRFNLNSGKKRQVLKGRFLKSRVDVNGILHVLTTDNLMKIDTKSSLMKSPKSNLMITKCFINDSIRPIKDLGFKENKLKFEIALVPSSPIKETKFNYFLVSGNDTLTGLVNDDYCELINLAPANYEFWATSSDLSTKHIKFEIRPPFWKSTSFFLVLLLVTALLLFLIARYIVLRNKRKFRLEQRIIELESASLRAQMNPHFLFNVMNTIQSIISEKDYENAERVLSKFSVLLRSALSYSEKAKISLKMELEFIKNYFFLEKMRFENEITLSIVISEKLDLEQTFVPPLIVQPIVENALIHGLEKRKGLEGRVYIKIEPIDNQIEIDVLNNGRPFEPENMKKATSKGLSMVQNRLKINHPDDKLIAKPIAEDGEYVTQFSLTLTI